MLAPDYAEPIVGWRSWVATRIDGELLLCSPIYPTVWPVSDALHAVCRSNSNSRRHDRHPTEHTAPAQECQCGVYAVDDPKRSYVRGQGVAAIPGEVEEVVVGRVLLWGTVVECDNGWRAEYAYPAEVWLCERRPGATRGFFRQRAREDPGELEAIVQALGRYGVPVRTIAGSSIDDVAAALSE